MEEILYLDEMEQASALFKPQRVDVLRQLDEPRTCTEVAARLNQTPQWVYYHVSRLVNVGLVTRVSERQAHGIHEGIYQAKARSYWLSSRLIGRIGGRNEQDSLSFRYLLDLIEEVQDDVAAVAATATSGLAADLPSIGVSGEVRVRPEHRHVFLSDLRVALQDLFTRYGGAEGDAFKLALACYPQCPRESTP